MPRNQASPRSLLTAWALCLALSACSHASSPRSSTNAPKEDPMTAATGTTPLSGDEVSRRMLKLIGSLASNADLTAEHLEKHTGLAMRQADSGDGSFGAGAQIHPDWSYNLYVTRPAGSQKNKLIFDFARTGNERAPMTPICGLDFDAYAKELKGMGFQDSASYGEHGRVDHWNFQRPTLTLQVFIEGESNDSPEKIGHRCVKTITIE